MHNFKKIARIVLVLLVCVLILWGLDLALYPITFMRSDVHAITTQQFDDLIVGTSHGKMNIDPETMETVTGKTGHNICVGSEYPEDVYYLLQLACEKGNTPSRVIYDIDPGYFGLEKEEGNNYLLFFHEFPLSLSKLKYFASAIARCNFRTLLFPWYEYPLSYELGKVSTTLNTKLTNDYDVSAFKTDTQEYHESGWISRSQVNVEKLDAQKAFSQAKVFDKDKVKEKNMVYLEKVIGFCKEKGIELVAVSTPVPQPTLDEFEESYHSAWEYFGDFFEEHEVPYINFNAEYNDAFTHKLSAFCDYDGHMHERAARDFSKVLAGILTNEI